MIRPANFSTLTSHHGLLQSSFSVPLSCLCPSFSKFTHSLCFCLCPAFAHAVLSMWSHHHGLDESYWVKYPQGFLNTWVIPQLLHFYSVWWLLFLSFIYLFPNSGFLFNWKFKILSLDLPSPEILPMGNRYLKRYIIRGIVILPDTLIPAFPPLKKFYYVLCGKWKSMIEWWTWSLILWCL